MKFKRLIFFIGAFSIGILLGFRCSENPAMSGETPLNENIMLIQECCDGQIFVGNYLHTVWIENTLIIGEPLRIITINETFEVISDTIRFDSVLVSSGINFRYLEANNSGTKLLIVSSIYGDVSA